MAVRVRNRLVKLDNEYAGFRFGYDIEKCRIFNISDISQFHFISSVSTFRESHITFIDVEYMIY